MTRLHELLDPRPSRRRRALDEMTDRDATTHYALRAALLLDRDATVRARAAERLARFISARRRSDTPIPAMWQTWLEEASSDRAPTVREAATRALGRLRRAGCVNSLARIAATDAYWAVRRAAIAGLARCAAMGQASERVVDGLIAALDDPFWRVRYAAARALVTLGQRQDMGTWVHDRALAHQAGTEWARAALAYVRRAWSNESGPVLEPAPRPEPIRLADARIDPAWDPDPAVMTARFEDGSFEPSLGLLLEAIADSHEPLRRQAVARLTQVVTRGAAGDDAGDAGDDARLRVALAWLDEPRIPHARDSVYKVLGALGDRARDLARAILSVDAERPRGAAGLDGPGAREWALSWIADTECTEIAHLIAPWMTSPHPRVRRAAARALGRLVASPHFAYPERDAGVRAAVACLARALDDDDIEVAQAAARSLSAIHHDEAAHALASLEFVAQPAAIQRAVVEAALRDDELLAQVGEALEGLDGPDGPYTIDPWACAQALSALAERDMLAPAVREKARAHADPWLYGAVMDRPQALAVWHAESQERDPQIRRAALSLLARYAGDGSLSPHERTHVALAAAHDADPWLRARACSLLDPARPAELCALLALLADRAPMARSAASERLAHCADGDHLVRALLDSGRAMSDRERSSAYTWLGRAFDEAAGDALAHALLEGRESPAVRAHLGAMLIAFPAVVERAGIDLARVGHHVGAAREHEAIEVVPAVVERRALGKTGIEMAPLCISGAYELSVDSLRFAYRAGVDAFFWEPRYQNMARFLREPPCPRDDLSVITGTFHASERAIEADLDRALRRLGRERVDVFLLFWTRSRARITDEVRAVMERLVKKGKIRARGISTHDRAIATEAAMTPGWDVIMVRHNAAHRGAEERVFPTALDAGVGVLGFSALCYGEMLRGHESGGSPDQAWTPRASDCYRYSLSRPGVSACVSAPRRHGELVENLEVLTRPGLDAATIAALRAHGDVVYRRNKDFNALIRREPRADWLAREELAESVAELLDEVAPPTHF